jgi:hypothetical protein
MNETQLTESQIQALYNKIELMRVEMFGLLDLIEQQDSGMSSEFCAKYPFDKSFDEQCFAVARWQANLKNKANFAGENDFDELLGTADDY